MVKIGEFYYKLQGFSDDECFHNCYKYKDSNGFQRVDKLKYIIKQNTGIAKKTSSRFQFDYSYTLIGAY